jgi:surface protein
MSNTINWGEIYSSSWFGKVDADNGWGNVYPVGGVPPTPPPDTDVYLAPNGVTVIAKPETVAGNEYTLNGVSYLVIADSVLDIRSALLNGRALNTICTSKVTDLGFVFDGNHTLDEDMSNWDVSNVTRMNRAFTACRILNQDFTYWDTSNVDDMTYVFGGALVFNGDISNWNTSSVTKMGNMFNGASIFNGNISSWDTSNVTNMFAMFLNAKDFNQDISVWDVSNTTNIQGMFYQALDFNKDLSGWCVSQFASQPSGFDTGATSWTEPRPVWGTCP